MALMGQQDQLLVIPLRQQVIPLLLVLLALPNQHC
jgi:hypothetical protein